MMTSVTADVLDTDTLKLLADPLRAQIVALLAHESLCVCHIVEETGAQQTNVSNHLRVLRRAGLVQTEPHGRYTYYRLRTEALAGLAAQLEVLTRTATRSDGRRRPCP